MKRYFLIIDWKKIRINILEDSKSNYKKKLSKLKEKYHWHINEMRFNEEIKSMIAKSKKKITESDIRLLVNSIKEALSVWASPSSVKELFLETYKDDKDINPIFIVLLLSWHSIIDILKQLEFPKKEIYIETLESWKQYEKMYDDIMKIERLTDMEEKLKKNIQKTIIFWVVMMTLAFGLTIWFKLILLPKIHWFITQISTNVWDWVGAGWPSLSTILINIISIVVISIYTILILLFLLKWLFPKLFYKIMLRVPLFWEIIRLQNDIYIYMLYSFNNTKATEFENKLKKFFSSYVDFKVYQYNDIPHLVQKTFYAVQKELGTSAFHIRVYSFLKTVVKDPNPDRLITLKIVRYYETIEEKTNTIKSFVQNAVLTLIGLIIWTLAITLFSTIKETQTQIQQMQR